MTGRQAGGQTDGQRDRPRGRQESRQTGVHKKLGWQADRQTGRRGRQMNRDRQIGCQTVRETRRLTDRYVSWQRDRHASWQSD